MERNRCLFQEMLRHDLFSLIQAVLRLVQIQQYYIFYFTLKMIQYKPLLEVREGAILLVSVKVFLPATSTLLA